MADAITTADSAARLDPVPSNTTPVRPQGRGTLAQVPAQSAA